MNSKTVKAMPKQYREYILKRALNEADRAIPAGKDKRFMPRQPERIAHLAKGDEMARAKSVLDKLPDQLLATKVFNTFTFLPKYQALNLFVDDKSEMAQQFPNELIDLVEAMIEVDFKVDTEIRGPL